MSSQEKLLDPERDFMVKQITEIFEKEIVWNVAELVNLFKKENLPILNVNKLIQKIQNASGTIERELRPYVNKQFQETERIVYQKHIYNQLSELYENYTTEDGKLDWKTIAKEKGQKFVNHFPLQDAIKAAIMVKEGKLIID